MSDDSEPTEAWEDHWLEPTEDWNDNYNKFKEQDGAGIAIAVIALVVGLFGLAANSQIFLFYWRKRKDLVPSLYLTLSCTDFLVSLTAILHFVALILLVTDQEESPEMVVFLAAVFAITTLILRVSVFVNVILIVVRTINITRPFYLVNRKALWVSVLVCFLVLLPLILYDTVRIKKEQEDFYATKVRYVFLPYVGDYAVKDIVMALNPITAGKGKKTVVRVPEYVTFATSCAPFILAVLISLVCLVVNYRELRASKGGLSKTGGGTAEQDITVTIALLTTVFSVCNTVYSLWIVLTWAFEWDYWTDQVVLQLCYVTSTLFPFISSSLNAIILIWRSKTLRKSLRNKFRRTVEPSNPTNKSYSTVVTNVSLATTEV